MKFGLLQAQDYLRCIQIMDTLPQELKVSEVLEILSHSVAKRKYYAFNQWSIKTQKKYRFVFKNNFTDDISDLKRGIENLPTET